MNDRFSMKMSGGPASLNFKISLIIIAFLIAGGTLYYTQSLVTKLQEKEKQIVQLYAKGIEYLANTNSPNVDITFLFDNIIKPIDFPMILTDPDDNVNLENINVRNIKYDSTLSHDKLQLFFKDKIKEMNRQHKPILVTYADSIVFSKIHYGDSDLINQLKFYPYVQIIIAAIFIVLGYIGFSNIKRTEQSNIWEWPRKLHTNSVHRFQV